MSFSLSVQRVAQLLSVAVVTIACEDKGKVSAGHAAVHVDSLVKVATEDVEEVRKGLPEGAKRLVKLWKEGEQNDLPEVHRMLHRTREDVQDLRVAKSTFFALATPEGAVLRNDQEEDRMAGKNLLAAFPDLKKAVEGAYTETRGKMKEAAGVDDSRPDGQWVAGAPVVVEGKTAGLYVTGWSWSSYAYRLEFKLRGEIRSSLAKEDHQTKNEPLIYVFLAVDKDVFGAPVSPDVTLSALKGRDLLSKAPAGQTYTEALELTGRDYGLAVQRAPALGRDVAIAVLRSET